MGNTYVFSDRDLCQFLDVGYYVIEADSISAEVHDDLFGCAKALLRERDELSDPLARLNVIADNLHVKIPKLQSILQCPELHAGLESVLGEQYFRFPHSFVHASGEYDQSYHKDSPLPWGTPGGMRSHRPNWAMVFYYPQATTIDMGATEILPGTQYWNVDREGTGRTEGEDRLDAQFNQASMNEMSLIERDKQLAEQVAKLDRTLDPFRLEVPKGAIVLVHFDLFHRGTRRISTEDRFLFKFWYMRTTEPGQFLSRRHVAYSSLDARRQAVLAASAQWLGVDVEGSGSEVADKCRVSQEADLLARNYEAVHLNPDEVVKAFRTGNERSRRTATYALVNEPSLALMLALEGAKSAVVGLRLCSVFLLGETGSMQGQEVAVLLDKIVLDDDMNVRLTAINAMGRLLRRCLANGEVSFPHSVLPTFAQVLANASSRTARSGLTLSAERECIYIALLNIVSEGIAYGLDLTILDEIAQLVSKNIRHETDRYAKGVATEVIVRLAEVGVQCAVNESVELLRNERWAV